MKDNKFMNKVSQLANKAAFGIKKHSPEILLVGGTIGIVTSAVLACKASTKVGALLDEAKTTVNNIHEIVENPENAEKYTEEDGKKAVAVAYVQTGLKVARLYAPAIALGTVSIACLFASNNILRKRNVALAAAYATVDAAFKDYKGKVIDLIGEEAERKLRLNLKSEIIEETEVDENGEMKTVTKTVDVVDPNGISMYSKIFDETNPNYERNPEYNLMFLRAQQQYANDLLKARGVGGRVFLNEVYSMLGFEPTKAGQVVGWKNDPNSNKGDNYIDFGIYNVYSESARNFVNGLESAVLLDFNVDGNIWEDM